MYNSKFTHNPNRSRWSETKTDFMLKNVGYGIYRMFCDEWESLCLTKWIVIDQKQIFRECYGIVYLLCNAYQFEELYLKLVKLIVSGRNYY